MTVSHVEILVEEPSTEALLRGLLPRALGERVSFEIHVHQGKRSLLAKLEARLRAYGRWIAETTRVLVVVDRDNDDCLQLKRKLDRIAINAELVTRSKSPQRWVVANRIAIEELESWYFGDWQAVREVYPRLPANIPSRAEYREPDRISGGTWEAFERVLKGAGYCEGGLRKIESARLIAPHMRLHGNRSASFRALQEVLAELGGEHPSAGRAGRARG